MINPIEDRGKPAMCGRMNVSDDPNVQAFMDALGMPIYPKPNPDLRPNDTTLVYYRATGNAFTHSELQWGITSKGPSSSFIINARAETIDNKPTFSQAFQNQRGLVICNGWYEWKAEGTVKIPYLIQHTLEQPLLMAAIIYPEQNRFVTLTTTPNDKLANVHHRMPVIINADDMEQWLFGSSIAAKALTSALPSEAFKTHLLSERQQQANLF